MDNIVVQYVKLPPAVPAPYVQVLVQGLGLSAFAPVALLICLSKQQIMAQYSDPCHLCCCYLEKHELEFEECTMCNEKR